jgi:hydrophobic/amphiphilic exporter-1 (mainly G- bacteria), HAE1 family
MSLLARLSLANRGLVALVAVVIAAFGAFAVPSLKQQLLPSLEFPGAFVVTSYPGAAPEVVERQVTEPIETAMTGIPGLSEVRSTTREGSSTVQVEYEFGTDLTAAVNRMETELDRIDAQLPDDVDPVVLAGSTDDLPAVVLAASTGGDEQGVAERLRSTVLPEIQAIEGVRTARVTGARDTVVLIEPRSADLTATGIPRTAVEEALRANGITVPAGSVGDDTRSLPVQVGTPIASIDDLRGIPLTAASGNPVRLDRVADVDEQLAPATSFTRTNGAESLGIEVIAAPHGNAVDISHEIRDRLAALGAAAGTELTVVFDQAPYVESSIDSLSTEGLLGLVMAVIVILVFLLSVRSTLVIAVSIPLSVLVALIALYVGDQSLNLLTLGALTIAVGRVVDDSIVVLENIKRHLSYGESKQHAIVTGVREVAGAVTASTLTTVAVFAPIALVGGFVGQLFAPFAITVTVALLASLLVSLTVIPVLAYWFLRPAGDGVDEAAVRAAAEEKELRNPLQKAYLPVVDFATTRRWATVGIGLAVLAGTVLLGTRLETNFLDDSGGSALSIRQELPVGSSLATTDAAARQVEDVLGRTDGVESYQVTAGGTGLPWEGGGGNSTASYAVSLVDDADAADVRDRLRAEFDSLSGAGEITFGSGGGAGGGQLAVVVQSADPETLALAAERVRATMAGTPGVVDVVSGLSERAPRVDVTVDRPAAARIGLTEAAIGQIVAQAFRGSPAGQVAIGGETRDVVIRTRPAPATVEELRKLTLGPVSRYGVAYRLEQVAAVDEVDGPLEVTRIDGDRSVTVTGTAAGSNLGATTEELRGRLAALALPPGATFTIGGVSADQEEAFADLGLAVLAAIAIVFLIMVATFRSLVQPLILLVSIPFAATGAIGLLVATGTPLGVPALIGVLMLVGIVVTNAIVLMDLINQYRAQGMSVREAVVEGGRRRLRPILMTAVATIFALLPMALGLTGEGGFISQPLAVVVIGGLITSTLLTLVLVPTLYTLVEAAKERLGMRFAGLAPQPARAAAVGGGAGNGVAPPVDEEPLTPVPVRPAPSGALIDGTDQFEVLRLPRAPRTRPPTEDS